MRSMRLLVITPSFTPRGTSASVRVVHLVRYLHRLGHEIQVVTYDEQTQLLFSPPDPTLAAKVPESVKIHRVPAGIFHRWADRSKRRGGDARGLKQRGTKSLLSSLIVPDPHIAAYRAFKRAAMDVINTWKPEALITFSYPFTSVLVGAALKRQYPLL